MRRSLGNIATRLSNQNWPSALAIRALGDPLATAIRLVERGGVMPSRSATMIIPGVPINTFSYGAAIISSVPLWNYYGVLNNGSSNSMTSSDNPPSTSTLEDMIQPILPLGVMAYLYEKVHRKNPKFVFPHNETRTGSKVMGLAWVSQPNHIVGDKKFKEVREILDNYEAGINAFLYNPFSGNLNPIIEHRVMGEIVEFPDNILTLRWIRENKAQMEEAYKEHISWLARSFLEEDEPDAILKGELQNMVTSYRNSDLLEIYRTDFLEEVKKLSAERGINFLALFRKPKLEGAEHLEELSNAMNVPPKVSILETPGCSPRKPTLHQVFSEEELWEEKSWSNSVGGD